MLPQNSSNIDNDTAKIKEEQLTTTTFNTEQQVVIMPEVIQANRSMEDGIVLPNNNKQTSNAAVTNSNKAKERQGGRNNEQPTEYLEKMSWRGMDIQRYEHIVDGVTYCLVCAKNDIYKTFKNKYSFQRHAYLLHEGDNRKIFPCPVCEREFSRPDKMKIHKRDKHGDMNTPLANGDGAVLENSINTPPPAKRTKPRVRKPRNSLASTSDIPIPDNDEKFKQRLAKIESVLDEVQNAVPLEDSGMISPAGAQLTLANTQMQPLQRVINIQPSSFSPLTTAMPIQIQPKLETIPAPTLQQTMLGNVTYLPFTASALPGQSYQVLTPDALRSYQSVALKQKINEFEVGPYVMATTLSQPFRMPVQPPKTTHIALHTTASIPNPTLIKVETAIPTATQSHITTNANQSPQLTHYALQNVGHLPSSTATPSNHLAHFTQAAIIKLDPSIRN